MPPAPIIPRLPSEIRAWLDQELAARGFGGYEEVTGLLNGKLAEHGMELSLSMPTVGRYGLDLKRKIERIRAATAAATAIASAAPDDEAQQSAAVTSLLSTEMFERLLELEDSHAEADPVDRIELISKAARAHADLTRASIAQRKWAAEVRRQTLAEVAERVDAAAQARGLSAEDARFWREQVLMGV